MRNRQWWSFRPLWILVLCGTAVSGYAQRPGNAAEKPVAPARSTLGRTALGTSRYHAVGGFSGPLAPARTSYAIQRKGEGTYGYIDKRGLWVVPPVFDAVSPPILPPEAPLPTGKAAPRTATFRGSRYTVDDAGVLRLAGKRVTPDDVATGAFIKETASDKLLTRMGAHRGLGRLATARATAALANVPARRGWQETTAAAQGLEEARPGAGVEYLIGFMSHKDENVRQAALYALLVLCRDPHCEREVPARIKLLPPEYRQSLALRMAPTKTDDTPKEKLDPADRALRRRLRDRIPAIAFPDVPLELVLMFFDEVMGRPRCVDPTRLRMITVDWDALAAAGVTRKTMVLTNTTDVRLGAGLREMFLNIGGTVPLDYEGSAPFLTSISTLPTGEELIAWGKKVAAARAQYREEAAAARARGRRQRVRNARDAKAYPAVSKRLAAKLPKLNFPHVPLERVMDYMREMGNMPIYLDWRGLSKGGIAKDVEVNCHLVDVTFIRALEVMLDSVAGKADLGYCVAAGILVVSTEQNLSVLRKAFVSPVLAQGAKDDPLVRKLRLRLRRVHLPRVPLAVAVEYVQAKILVPIVVDWDRLAKAGITKQTKINVVGLESATAAAVLEILFYDAGGAGRVRMTVKKDVVIVTTKARPRKER